MSKGVEFGALLLVKEQTSKSSFLAFQQGDSQQYVKE